MAEDSLTLSTEAKSLLEERGLGPFVSITLPHDPILEDDSMPEFEDWSEGNIDLAKEQGKKYPELARAIEEHITVRQREQAERVKEIADYRKQLADSKSKSKKNSQDELMQQKLRQLADKMLAGSGANAIAFDTLSAEGKAKLEAATKNLVLEERYKPLQGLKFDIPGKAPTKFVLELKALLNPLGYDVYCIGEKKFKKRFESVQAYRKYQKENGLPRFIPGSLLPDEDPNFIVIDPNEKIPEGYMLFCMPPYPREFSYDPQKANEKQGFFILPGQTIERLGDENSNKYQATSAISIELTGMAGIGMITKIVQPEQVITAIGTSGPNYGVSNDMVARQVQAWHKEFGVKLLNLGFDKFSMAFANKPKDLSKFITDAWVFDPDLFEMYGKGHPKENAACVREFANRIEKSGIVEFWWD